MSYLPGADAEALREIVGEFLGKHCTEADVRASMADPLGHDRDLWRRLAVELGLHGLVIDSRFGGSDASAVELGVVFVELGAVLYPGPFMATVGLAATALIELGDADAATRYLPGIAAGDTVATLAWAGDSPAGSTLTATAPAEAGEWTVSGAAGVVLAGADADLVLVAAQTPDGMGLFSVEAQAAGLDRIPLFAMDQTRRLARLEFTAAPAALLGSPGAGTRRALARTFDLAVLYLAAEQLGGAARVLADSVSYARTRYQFGRAIGSFQAIKHRCADMLVDVESARSSVYRGLSAAAARPAGVDDGGCGLDDGGLAEAAALARSIAADAYQRVASHNIQIHGGIGFTWEHPAHLYLKRAKSSQLLFGHPAAHRAKLAGLLGLTGPTVAAEPPADAARETGSDERDAGLDAVVTEFLAAHPVPGAGDLEAEIRYRQARFDAGLAVVNFDSGHGGRGLDPARQAQVEQRFAAAGAPDHTARNVIGLGMALPTIHAHGSPQQRAAFLRPGFSSEHIWCQLFSEPGAGSDLAALATRAVADGDEFVINGQKVWTSLAHVADWGLLVARTDPDVPKHQGLTYFLLDMRSPGVEVRPLRQLTGEAEFNEVYLTDVCVPAANVLGAVGGGWSVAMTTLANERVSLGAHASARGSGPIAQAVETYRRAAGEGRADAVVTERLMLLWTAAEAARLTNERARTAPGRRPGPEGSIAKLQMAELNKAIYEFCVDVSGQDGLLVDDDYPLTAPAFAAVHGGAVIGKAYLRSLANSIEGGTSEILRNILGERVLGLPGEPRLDRDRPWKDVPRS